MKKSPFGLKKRNTKNVLSLIVVIVIIALIGKIFRKDTPATPATPGTPDKPVTQEAPGAQVDTEAPSAQVDTEAPKAVAMKWRDAIVAGNLAAANVFSTEKQKATNKILIEVVCKQDAAFAKGFAGADFNDVSIKDEKATIKSTNFKHDAIFLIKLDGNWMVGTTK